MVPYILLGLLVFFTSLLCWQLLGYPLFMALIYRIKDNIPSKDYAYQPFISIIVPTYNEESVVAERIKNVLSQNYPKTKYEVIEYYKSGKYQFSLLDVNIETGRTHQIRVHMKHTGFPVVGDRLYTKGRDRKIWEEIGAGRQFLHAYRLKFSDPLTNKIQDIKIGLPSDLGDILKKMAKIVDNK